MPAAIKFGLATSSSSHSSDGDRSEKHTGAVPKVLNMAEAAQYVRCSRAHLCNIVNGKICGIPHLPAIRIGRRVLFRRESLESWLEQVESAASESH